MTIHPQPQEEEKPERYFLTGMIIISLVFGYLVYDTVEISKKFKAYDDYNKRNRVDTVYVNN